jgi:hypothetical protein
MRVQHSETKGVDQRTAQQAGTGMNTEVRIETFDESDGIGAVEWAGFEERDAA